MIGLALLPVGLSVLLAVAGPRLARQVPGRTATVLLTVAALVAGSSSGSYAVDVVRRDGTTKRVAVEVGFVAEGRAAVTGDVSVGDEVVVPS